MRSRSTRAVPGIGTSPTPPGVGFRTRRWLRAAPLAACLALGALPAMAPVPACAISLGGATVPSYNNFCGQQQLEIPVTVCNTASPGTGIQWYGVELRSGTFVGCGDTFEPQYSRTPSFWGLDPGECATFEVTLQRPSILDWVTEACLYVRIHIPNGAAWSLGIFVSDSEVTCAHWGFYEAEWARFLHPSGPVTQLVELANPGSSGLDIFYEIRALDANGEPLLDTISLNGREPGTPLRGFAVIYPGESWPVDFELEWTDSEVSGPVELALLADIDFDGNMERLSSIPLLNAQVFGSGGLPANAPTATPALSNQALQLQIAPNPFNPAGVVSFELGAPGLVSADILDPRGRVVRALIDAQRLDAGKHERRWDGRDAQGGLVANGVYLVRVNADGLVETGRAVLLK